MTNKTGVNTMTNKQTYESPTFLLRPLVADTTIATELNSGDDNAFDFGELT